MPDYALRSPGQTDAQKAAADAEYLRKNRIVYPQFEDTMIRGK